MAVWAIAWAGTKPLASLTDGWVASAHGIRWAVAVVAGPALVLGLLEFCLPQRWKARIKDRLTRAATRRSGQDDAAGQAAGPTPPHPGRRPVPDPPPPGLPLVAPVRIPRSPPD
jgi:hypothetical protein